MNFRKKKKQVEPMLPIEIGAMLRSIEHNRSAINELEGLLKVRLSVGDGPYMRGASANMTDSGLFIHANSGLCTLLSISEAVALMDWLNKILGTKEKEKEHGK